MKLLSLFLLCNMLILLLSIVCTANVPPKFKVGECVTPRNLETWDQKVNTFKILEIGKTHYRNELVLEGPRPLFLIHVVMPDSTFDTVDYEYDLIACPKSKSR